MAHAQGKPGIINAIRAGVRSVEHGVFADEECFELLKAHDVWLVPTLTAPVALNRMIAGGAPIPAEVVRKTELARIAHAEMIVEAVAADVKIAMGTDSGVFPHGGNLEELQLMREAGMTPEAVLHAATASAAELLELDDRGRFARAARRCGHRGGRCARVRSDGRTDRGRLSGGQARALNRRPAENAGQLTATGSMRVSPGIRSKAGSVEAILPMP